MARCRPTRCSLGAWSGSALRHDTSSTAQRAGSWRTPPAALRCNRISSRSWKADEHQREEEREKLMAKQLAAVLGTGQTKYVAKRKDVWM